MDSIGPSSPGYTTKASPEGKPQSASVTFARTIACEALAEGGPSGFDGEIEWDASMPNGQPRRSLDASRADEFFGFRARTQLREGLERTVDWYRAHALAGDRA